jgi:CRP-like cAMP-binding protein
MHSSKTSVSRVPILTVVGAPFYRAPLKRLIKGVVREICPNPNGTQTLVRLATASDILGLADKLDEKGQWIRRFEAWTATQCVLAIVTRQQVRNLLKDMSPEELLALSERMNSASSEWVQYYATFLGLSYRERIEMVMAELGRKFGVPDSDGVLLTFEPTTSDFAEMIGSSRPVIGRVMADLIEDGEIGRRDRKYILLHGGAIEAAVSEGSHLANGHVPPSKQPAASSRSTTHLQRQHRWGDSRDSRKVVAGKLRQMSPIFNGSTSVRDALIKIRGHAEYWSEPMVNIAKEF